jgi:hypothetical protein
MSVAVSIVRTEWKSSKPNPDEELLKESWRAELDAMEKLMAEEGNLARRQQNALLPLLRASGLGEGDLELALAESRQLSRQSLKETEPLVMKPSLDIARMHDQDLELVKSIAAKIVAPAKATAWSGYVMHPECHGHQTCWNGEAEEVPYASEDPGTNRMEVRTQAFGEGWWDADSSDASAYLTFRITPPSWGQLDVYACVWAHGYYNLFADDSWYKGEYASATMQTWMDLHQNFWRPRSSRTRFHRGGDELHPLNYGRIDERYMHGYHTAVGEGDIVTLRVGGRLRSQARASGGRSILDFRSGSANHVYVPYVHWRLRQ